MIGNADRYTYINYVAWSLTPRLDGKDPVEGLKELFTFEEVNKYIDVTEKDFEKKQEGLAGLITALDDMGFVKETGAVLGYAPLKLYEREDGSKIPLLPKPLIVEGHDYLYEEILYRQFEATFRGTIDEVVVEHSLNLSSITNLVHQYSSQLGVNELETGKYLVFIDYTKEQDLPLGNNLLDSQIHQ